MIENFEITKLNENLRAAALGNNRYYGAWFQKQASEYHKEGRTWPFTKLKFFFQDGLLSYYLGYILGLKITDYAGNEKEKFLRENTSDIASLFNKLCLPVDTLTDRNKWLECIVKLFEKINDLEVLSVIGAKFQRIKQLNEFLIEKKTSTELLAICQNDKLLEDLQTIIYNWALYYFEEVKNFLGENKYDILEIEKNINNFFPAQIPIFIIQHYNDLFNELTQNGYDAPVEESSYTVM